MSQLEIKDGVKMNESTMKISKRGDGDIIVISSHDNHESVAFYLGDEERVKLIKFLERGHNVPPLNLGGN